MKNVVVSDVTLKFPLQENGKELSFREKLSVAKNLERVGVNVIELPACHSKNEEKIVNKTISESVRNSIVAIDCGISEEEINFAYDCVKDAKAKRLQVVLPVSTVQMEYGYHLKAPKMLEKISKVVGYASSLCEVEFIAKDATRAEEGYIVEVAKTAYTAGAKIITLVDDCGDGFSDAFTNMIKEIKSACDIAVFIEPSNKIKMAPAIAVEALKIGVDGVKTSVKEGLNLAVLSDIVRFKGKDINVSTTLDYTLINQTIKEIASVSFEQVERKISNQNSADLDESLSVKEISDKIAKLGYELSNEDTGRVYEEFKRVCSKKGAIGERELEAIVASTAMQVPSTFHLVSYVVNSGNIISATANIAMEKDGAPLCGVSTGDGPIDAAFHAIEQIIGHHYELDDLNVSAVTKGREAVGSAIVRLRANGKLYSGNGVSTDIVGACIRAYVNALNKIVHAEK